MNDKINLNVILMSLFHVLMMIFIVAIAILMFVFDIAKVSVTVVGVTESMSASISEIDDTFLCIIATILLMVPAIFSIVATFVLDSKKQKDLIKFLSMSVSAVAVVGIVILCITLFESETLFGATAKITPTITTYIAMILSLCSLWVIAIKTFLNK